MPAEQTSTSIRPSVSRCVLRGVRHRLRVGDIDCLRQRSAAERGRCARERDGIAIPQRDRRAAQNEALRDRESDTGGAAGDDRRAFREIELVHRQDPLSGGP